MNCFTRSIHGPGLGKNRNQAGCAASRKYGALIPAAIATNMARIMAADCVKANPSAVPKNGAVHGVARTVAKTPWKKEPALPALMVEATISRVANCGSEISKTPKRFRAKTTTITLMKRTKYGLVN